LSAVSLFRSGDNWVGSKYLTISCAFLNGTREAQRHLADRRPLASATPIRNQPRFLHPAPGPAPLDARPQPRRRWLARLVRREERRRDKGEGRSPRPALRSFSEGGFHLPICSTLNPQPSTLNSRGRLLLRSPFSFLLAGSHLPINAARRYAFAVTGPYHQRPRLPPH
jgi:hypothetical protein